MMLNCESEINQDDRMKYIYLIISFRILHEATRSDHEVTRSH